MFRILFVLLIASLTSCAPPLALRPNAEIKTLSIQLEFEEKVPVEIQNEFNRQLDDFILGYNATNWKLKVARADEIVNKNVSISAYTASGGKSNSLLSKNTLLIRVHDTHLVTTQQNTNGIIVSAIGLATPFILVGAGSPFYIAFWYFPHTISSLEWQLSQDINGSRVNPFMHLVKSPGFLKSQQKQIQKHGVFFNKLLYTRIKQLQSTLK